MGAGLRNRMLVGGVAVVLAVAAATGYAAISIYRSRPLLDAELHSTAVSDAIELRRDDDGAVTIAAANEQDALFALGFVHAQERFFQMDVLRRTAAGELAALLGAEAVESDRQARLHALERVAHRAVEALPARQLALLDSYSKGVNEGLAALGAPPFEYTLLRAAPREWQHEDSLLVQLSMYLLLQGPSTLHPEIVREELARRYDQELVTFLLDAGAEWDTPMDGERGVRHSSVLPASLQLGPAPARVARHAASLQQRYAVGSNNWVVRGSKTADGRAILANDLHLPLQMPNTLFHVAIELNGREHAIVGAGVPGTPMLMAGSNGQIAWGVTNANGDFSDVVRIDKSGARLWSSAEEIDVRGGEPVQVRVETSGYGPVVAQDERYAYALKWVAHEVEGNDLDFLDMLTAQTLEQAARVAASSGVPHLNILMVDARGSALWTLAGRIPRREGLSGEQMQTWGEHVGWRGWLEPQEYPLLTSEHRETFWTANNRVVSGEALAKVGIGAQFAPGIRARRIAEALDTPAVVNEKDMHALQLDDGALLMTRWHELTAEAAATVTDPQARTKLIELLADWQGRAKADSAAYRVVRRYRDELADDLMPQLLSQLLRERPDLQWYEVLPNYEAPLWKLVSARPAHIVPAGAVSWEEYLREVLVRDVYESYEQQYGDVRKAVWGDANVVSIRHQLSGAVPLLGRLLDMPSESMNGDQDTIIAQFRGFGPAMRMVVAPGHERDGILTMPGGQAGNPFAPYYGRGHEAWAKGAARRLMPGATKHRLSVLPRRVDRST